jgi:hypothetical protein
MDGESKIKCDWKEQEEEGEIKEDLGLSNGR